MFTFITEADLKTVIKAEFYNNLIAGLAQADLDRIEAASLQTVLDKLRHRYDVDTLKSAVTKDERIIQWVVTIMAYQLHRRQNSRGVPDNVATDYDATITWLNDIRDGKEHPDFPVLPNDEDGNEDLGSNDLRYGGNTPFNWKTS